MQKDALIRYMDSKTITNFLRYNTENSTLICKHSMRNAIDGFQTDGSYSE